MNVKINILNILMFFCVLNITQAQNRLGYFVENDSIVFDFSSNDYQYFSSDKSKNILSIDEISIQTVSVAGEFNKWSKTHWKLKKISKGNFRLSVHINEFLKNDYREFKFVVNEEYWAEPHYFKNTIPIIGKYLSLIESNNLVIYDAIPSINGNVVFKLKDYKNAKKVIVSGTFNKWDENIHEMYPTPEGWELKLHINPGQYEYKFIVDGQWITDPSNPVKIPNEFGGYNSVISVKTDVYFCLPGYENANEVILSGSFNGWNENDLKMKKTDSIWELGIELSGGKYHYKFIVDGEWTVDPNNTIKEYDHDGHINSVIMVR